MKTQHTYITALAMLLTCMAMLVVLPVTKATTHSNQSYVDPMRYHFVNTSRNFISDPHGTLNLFYDNLKILSSLKGAETTNSEPIQIPIIHFGDSHTQGGYGTEVTRRQLQRKFGNAGRGVVTPLKLSRSNEPRDYSISSNTSFVATRIVSRTTTNNAGITGICIKPNNTNSQFQISLIDTPDDPLHYDFTRVRALHSPNAPLITTDTQNINQNSFNESHNDCETIIELEKPCNKITLQTYAHNNFKAGEFYGFSLENNHNGVIYHSIGVNSATYRHWGLLTKPAQQSAVLCPKLIIVSLGANETVARNVEKDVVYQQIHSFIAKLRVANPKTPIVLTTPVETMRRSNGRNYPNKSYVEVTEVIKQYAVDKKLAFYDLYNIMGGANSSLLLEQEKLLRPDKIHFTIEGYKLQGNLLYSALINSYDRYIRENN